MSNVTKKIDKKKQRFHMDVRKNVSVQESLCIELLLIDVVKDLSPVQLYVVTNV